MSPAFFFRAFCRLAAPLYFQFTDIKVTRDEKDSRIAIVTLNRPAQMNAWRDLGLMGSDMVRAFSQFDQDDSVRVIIVTG